MLLFGILGERLKWWEVNKVGWKGKRGERERSKEGREVYG